MYTKLLFIITVAAILSGCTAAYKTGQTPDDVYYSPERLYTVSVAGDSTQVSEDNSSYEDREIRMAINDPRWRYFGYDYSYDPYRYGYTYGYYYNPYYCTYPVYYNNIKVPVQPANSTPRTVNLSSYNTGYNNVNRAINSKFNNTGTGTSTVRSYNNNNVKPKSGDNNSNSKFVNSLKKILGNNNTDNSSSSGNSSSRTYNPSSGKSGSSSSSSSSSGSVSRPSRNR